MKTVTITHKQLAIRMLRGAHHLIDTDTDQCTMVCVALHAVEKRYYRDRPRGVSPTEVYTTCQQLGEWIESLLDGSAVLSGWLLKNGVELKSNYYRVRVTRLAWIDWMISELEALVEPEGEKHFPHSRVTL